jgi:regulatory protein
VDGDDERAAAEALVRRRLPSSRGLDYPKRVNRLVGMLARKGYGPGLAGDVVRRALAAEREDDDVEPLG